MQKTQGNETSIPAPHHMHCCSTFFPIPPSTSSRLRRLRQASGGKRRPGPRRERTKRAFFEKNAEDLFRKCIKLVGLSILVSRILDCLLGWAFAGDSSASLFDPFFRLSILPSSLLRSFRNPTSDGGLYIFFCTKKKRWAVFALPMTFSKYCPSPLKQR